MATLLTVDQLREHIETDLLDDALGRLNDDADASVIDRYGPLASETQQFLVDSGSYPDGRDKIINLTRKPSSITSITEQLFDNTPTVLAADDYELVGSQLRRLDTGTNPRSVWGHVVNVTYVPDDTTARRKGVIIDLVKLEDQFSGLRTEWAGDHKEELPEYTAAYEAVLKKLQPRLSFA